jgi:hypothetical protein
MNITMNKISIYLNWKFSEDENGDRRNESALKNKHLQ